MKEEIKILFHELNSSVLAEIQSNEIVIKDIQDALDLIANCGYQGATGIIIYKKNLTEKFFNLRTKMAGEILQKFSNYNMRLAIIGDFSSYSSQSLKDFIFESNQQKQIIFTDSVDRAKGLLSYRI